MTSLGLDLGTNSIGWCLIDEQRHHIIHAGVRIFSDGREAKTKTSLAVARREARGQSRRRDRYQRRRKALLRTLIDYGLMPADKAGQKALLEQTDDGKNGHLENSLYGLRAKALDEALEPEQVGRILFHLNQRRGFKSNRKTDKRDNEAGKIETGVARLDQAMMAEKARTYGEYLYIRRKNQQSVRTRLRPESGEDAKGTGYDFYPSRAMLEKEFDAIWAAQSSFHADSLTDERRDHLFKIIFHQRPLKAPKIGRCTHNPDELRIAKAHPLFQTFRVTKEINELEIVDKYQRHHKLTIDQRNKLISMLRSTKKARFSTLRKVLKLEQGLRFNKETNSRIDLLGDETYTEMSAPDKFGVRWATFSESKQWEIINKIREEQDPETLNNWLMGRLELSEETAKSIAFAKLPEGYGRMGETALRDMLEHLKAEVIPESDAAKRCGIDHSYKRDINDPGCDQLPKYQEILERRIPPGSNNPDDPYDLQKGRITNPTVHIGLNQLRRVVNAIIRKYGKPDHIVIELARDLKLNEKQKDDVNKSIEKNTRDAEKRSDKLNELSVTDNGRNRLILKLWEELGPPEDRVCIYSGRPIKVGMLFNGETDIDHILPFSRTLDDHQSNKILCVTDANRQKRNRAPGEVIEWQDKYPEILARVKKLPQNKRWRFGANALEEFEKKGGFLARQLTDTQYLSRLALEYLEALFPAEEPDQYGEYKRRKHVSVVPGKLTEMLRRKWGLNSILWDSQHFETVKEKNRMDHRHHAIDAAVIAVTSNALVQKISQTAARAEADQLDNLIDGENIKPWPSFRDDLKKVIDAVIVSHKADHGSISRHQYAQGKGQTAGKLHKETAYGFTDEVNEKGSPLCVRRIAITEIKSEKDIFKIRDEELRNRLWTASNGLKGKEFELAVLKFSKTDKIFQGTRRVRILEAENPIAFRDNEGKIYKGYLGGKNYRFDLWALPDGKWEAEVISMFEAHQPGFIPKIRQDYHNPKKIASLMIGDMVAYDHPETSERVIARVRKFNHGNKQIYLDPHNQAGSLDKRHKNEEDPFKSFNKLPNKLKPLNLRQIRIDEIGQVFDPGPIVI